ncbi:hypothetical protein [Microbacterium lacticum]
MLLGIEHARVVIDPRTSDSLDPAVGCFVQHWNLTPLVGQTLTRCGRSCSGVFVFIAGTPLPEPRCRPRLLSCHTLGADSLLPFGECLSRCGGNRRGDLVAYLLGPLSRFLLGYTRCLAPGALRGVEFCKNRSDLLPAFSLLLSKLRALHC